MVAVAVLLCRSCSSLLAFFGRSSLPLSGHFIFPGLFAIDIMSRFVVAATVAASVIAGVDAGCCPTPTGTCCSGACDCQFSESLSRPETLKELFDDFRKTHSRMYSTMDEEMHRYNIFVDTLKTIDER